MKGVLLTGANGFTGYYIAKALLRQGFSVTATGLGAQRLPISHERFAYQTMDFTSEEAVREVMETVQPGTVIHGGALSKPDECAADKKAAVLINVKGTEHLLAAAASVGAHFIFLSTDFVFSGSAGPYKEDDPTGPVNFYGHTKCMAEAAVRRFEGPWSIVRTVLVYGKSHSGRPNFLHILAGKLAAGEGLRIFGDQVRTPTYVEDLAWGIARIAALKATGVFHLSGPDRQTPYTMAVAVARHLGLGEDLIAEETEASFPQPEKRPKVTGFILQKAGEELGYAPTPFAEGLRRTFALD